MAWPQARHFNGKKVRRSHSRNWKRGECYSLAWEKYKYKNDFIIKVRLRPPAWGTTGGKSVAQACYRKVEIPQLSPFLQASEHGMGLWWLILCVYLARPWCPDTWSNTILDVSLKGAFFFFWADKHLNLWILSKAAYPHTVGGPHLISWWPSQSKGWPPQARGNFATDSLRLELIYLSFDNVVLVTLPRLTSSWPSTDSTLLGPQRDEPPGMVEAPSDSSFPLWDFFFLVYHITLVIIFKH